MHFYIRRLFNVHWLIVWLSAAVCVSAAPVWLRLQTDDFLILSDASQKDIVEFAVGYTAYRQAFCNLLAPAGRRPPPTTIVLFKNKKGLRDLVLSNKREDDEIVAYTCEVDGSALMALSVSGDYELSLARLYEFETIWALKRIGYSLPLWMSHGTGEVFSSLKVERGRYQLGNAPEGLQAFFLESPDFQSIAWTDFCGINQTSRLYRGKDFAGSFHAQAWAYMYWILMRDGMGNEHFKELAYKLKMSTEIQSTEAVFGLNERQLMGEITKFASRGANLTPVVFDDKAVRKQMTVMPAADYEVGVNFATLLSSAGKNERSDRELERAVASAPKAVCVLEAQARRALRIRDFENALKLYRESISAGTLNPYAYLTSANARIGAKDIGVTDIMARESSETELALAEARKAVDLDPGNANAYILLGQVFNVRKEVTEADILELSPGVPLDKEGLSVRYLRAVLNSRIGNKQSAIADLHMIIASRNTPPSLLILAKGWLEYENSKN